MSEPIREHALHGFLATRGGRSETPPGLIVRVQPEHEFVNLRGDPAASEFRDAIETLLGQPLPVTANTCGGVTHTCYWLGPDEWLVVSPFDSAMGAEMAARLAGTGAAVNVQDGGLLQLQLEGAGARPVLARGCTLNLEPDAFRAGQCAQTGLAKAGVLIAPLADESSFRLVVRRSFAEYVALWLARAGSESGVDFVQD